jgi:hypothetical protein
MADFLTGNLIIEEKKFVENDSTLIFAVRLKKVDSSSKNIW